MIQDLNLYPNLQGRGLVSGPNDSTPPALAFMQGDTYRLVLNGLLPVLDNSLDLFAPAHIQWSRLSAGITLIDAPPTGGTFKVRAGLADSASLNFNIGKGELQAALNAMATITAAGGIDVSSGGAANIYRLQWRVPANALTLTVVENELSPLTLNRVAVDPDVLGKVELKLYQSPVTLTDQFSLPSAPAITISQVRGGSALRNEVQRITVPSNAIGSFALDWLAVAGVIIPVSTVTAAAIEAAINDPFYALNSDDKRFPVTNPATGVFDIEFVGQYAQTAGLSLIGIEMFDQVPIDTPVGNMSLDNQAIEDFLDGAASGRALFEIRAYADGNKTMLAHQMATILNDGIDSEVASQAGTVATQTNTVYVYPNSTTFDPGFSGHRLGAGLVLHARGATDHQQPPAYDRSDRRRCAKHRLDAHANHRIAARRTPSGDSGTLTVWARSSNSAAPNTISMAGRLMAKTFPWINRHYGVESGSRPRRCFRVFGILRYFHHDVLTSWAPTPHAPQPLTRYGPP